MAFPDPKPRFDNPGGRIMSVLTFVFGQKRVLPFLGGIGHFVIFWGFLDDLSGDVGVSRQRGVPGGFILANTRLPSHWADR